MSPYCLILFVSASRVSSDILDSDCLITMRRVIFSMLIAEVPDFLITYVPDPIIIFPEYTP